MVTLAHYEDYRSSIDKVNLNLVGHEYSTVYVSLVG